MLTFVVVVRLGVVVALRDAVDPALVVVIDVVVIAVVELLPAADAVVVMFPAGVVVEVFEATVVVVDVVVEVFEDTIVVAGVVLDEFELFQGPVVILVVTITLDVGEVVLAFDIVVVVVFGQLVGAGVVDATVVEVTDVVLFVAFASGIVVKVPETD